MTKETIVIVGYGYVGKAIADFFKDHYRIWVYDPAYFDKDNEEVEEGNERMKFTNNKNQVNGCDMAVVCVPTPSKEDGSVDISLVEQTMEWLNTPVMLIKSTIPPGTTEYLIEEYGKPGVVFSPEYIGEGKYQVQWWKDKAYPHPTNMKYHDFFTFGGERKYTKDVIEFFKKVVGPDPKYIQTDSKTAELVKYMENSWGSMKVMFCNEFYEIAEKFGIDYNELRELFLLDGRVERMHTIVFEDKRGFGGKCFPKDVMGIIRASEKAGYEPKIMKQVIDKNKEYNNEI